MPYLSVVGDWGEGEGEGAPRTEQSAVRGFALSPSGIFRVLMLTFKIMMSLIDSETMMCVVDLIIMMSIVFFFFFTIMVSIIDLIIIMKYY